MYLQALYVGAKLEGSRVAAWCSSSSCTCSLFIERQGQVLRLLHILAVCSQAEQFWFTSCYIGASNSKYVADAVEILPMRVYALMHVLCQFKCSAVLPFQGNRESFCPNGPCTLRSYQLSAQCTFLAQFTPRLVDKGCCSTGEAMREAMRKNALRLDCIILYNIS